MQENENVICCFCGQGLTLESSIQIAFGWTKEPIETQGLCEAGTKLVHTCRGDCS